MKVCQPLQTFEDTVSLFVATFALKVARQPVANELFLRRMMHHLF